MIYKVIKEFMDRFIGLLLWIGSSPLWISITLSQLIVNRGVVLFIQRRSGINGHEFNILKFATMRPGNGLESDPTGRITPFGRILRSLSLDELPQLINVIKGDMSIVGPRPLLPEYTDRLSERHKLRFNVKPGITGLSQVNEDNRGNWKKRLDLDVEYIENRSFTLDLKILFKTITVLFRPASNDPEAFRKFEGY